MRRILFLLTLALFSWSALEMHEWVRVPEVLAHMLEHHSDLGHHDDGDGHCADEPATERGHAHDHDHDHSPFAGGCHGDACSTGAVVLPVQYFASIPMPSPSVQQVGGEVEAYVASFQGSKWNPPKHA